MCTGVTYIFLTAFWEVKLFYNKVILKNSTSWLKYLTKAPYLKGVKPEFKLGFI